MMMVMTGHRASGENYCQRTCRPEKCPGSGQDRANFFCSSWEEAWLGHWGYSIPLRIIAGPKGLSSGEKWFCLEEKVWWREMSGFACYQGFFLYFLISFVIDTVAVAVCFLMSLLFSVNSSYLNTFFSGNSKLENAIPKLQPPLAFKVLSQLCHVTSVDFT